MFNQMMGPQGFSPANMTAAFQLFGNWNKGVQAFALEAGSYSKRVFEDGTETFEQLANTQSIDQMWQIQADFVQRQMNDYVKQMTKFASIYADIAEEAYRPFGEVLKGATPCAKK